MGVFGKLFGKKEAKEDDLGLEPNMPQDELGLGEKPVIPEVPGMESTQEQLKPQNIPQQQISSRDIDLLSSKLDTVKAILNSMDQRIANLEKAAGVEQKKMPW